MGEYILVLTTVPDEKTSQDIARRLVKERLAGCVTVSTACQSFYWWEKKISQGQEFMLFIKTKDSLYEKLEESIKSLHPYSVPEIIAFPFSKGNREYLDWLDKETKS